MNYYVKFVPKQPHRMVLGVIDENAYKILGSLDESVESFPNILYNTNLPKSSVYVTLMKLVENDLVTKVGASYKLSVKGVLIYKTFYDVINGIVVTQAISKPSNIEPKVSALNRFLSGIKKIFSG
jgi:hypothetical protein